MSGQSIGRSAGTSAGHGADKHADRRTLKVVKEVTDEGQDALGSSNVSVNPSSSYVVLAPSCDGTQYLRPRPRPDNRDDDGEPLKFHDVETIASTIRELLP